MGKIGLVAQGAGVQAARRVSAKVRRGGVGTMAGGLTKVRQEGGVFGPPVGVVCAIVAGKMQKGVLR